MSDECNGGLGEMYDHYEDEYDEQSWGDCYLYIEEIEYDEKPTLKEIIDTYKKLYKKAKNAKIKEMIWCPVCQKVMVKRTYQHTFCSTKHKDKYWNTVDDKRRMRAKHH